MKEPTAPPAEKRVPTRFPVLEELAARWSPRSFLDRAPDDGQLGAIFEAARLAPSAHNTQPSRFLLGRKGRGDTHARLVACLAEHNRVWAPSVPVLVLASVMRKRLSQADGTMVPYPHAMHDLGLAVMSAIVQALPEELRAKERAARTRRALEEVVFEGAWGSPAVFRLRRGEQA